MAHDDKNGSGSLGGKIRLLAGLETEIGGGAFFL
jgi:hypothetical protein